MSKHEEPEGNSPGGNLRRMGSFEMTTLLTDVSPLIVPKSPHKHGRSHVALENDDDLDKDPHLTSDHFELQDGDEYDDNGSEDSSAHGGGTHGMAHGTATPGQVAVNIFISFVGAGLLGLPYAFSRSGWLLGSLSLAAVSCGNVYTMLLLVKCRKKLQELGHTGINGYGDVGREVIGPRGEVLVNVCLVVSQAGFATAYLIFIASNVQSITGGVTGRAMVIYGCTPILAFLVQFRDMKKLSPSSLVADGEFHGSDLVLSLS